MRIAFLIKILYIHQEYVYETIDIFIESVMTTTCETLEEQIQKKYPQLGTINHCDGEVIDVPENSRYLIVSKYL
jgi:hypothetical protein